MYDSEDSTDKYKTLKISIGGMIKKMQISYNLSPIILIL